MPLESLELIDVGIVSRSSRGRRVGSLFCEVAQILFSRNPKAEKEQTRNGLVAALPRDALGRWPLRARAPWHPGVSEGARGNISNNIRRVSPAIYRPFSTNK